MLGTVDTVTDTDTDTTCTSIYVSNQQSTINSFFVLLNESMNQYGRQAGRGGGLFNIVGTGTTEAGVFCVCVRVCVCVNCQSML